MHIISMERDEWKGDKYIINKLMSPTIHEIKSSIYDLDQSNRTMIICNFSDESFFCVGGGANKYICYYCSKDEELWNLIDRKKNKEKKINLNSGGQEGEYPENQIINYDFLINEVELLYNNGFKIKPYWFLQE